MNELLQAITPILLALLVGIIGYLAKIAGIQAQRVADKYAIKAKLDANKTIVNLAVKYVQQVFNEADNKTKYNEAKNKALEILSEKGIKITDAELNMLIEASVANFKQGMKETVTLENPSIGENIVASEVADKTKE
ncbi:MAG: phage holin family protein [Staphylococcus equorum]|nr:phage holin family protein [Staphylococcus equorum]MDN6100790.1 phage holin family protein [Lactococcus lactis]MDN6120238.1 phage holin family protein [Lactococcus lactis]MDN6504830.1 phage holin family protein [Lactococcus lactis]MDN6570303.1 phage holin family protein [Staphylococcus equorum]